jgi:flagellar basal body-associated protein FliL
MKLLAVGLVVGMVVTLLAIYIYVVWVFKDLRR